MKEGKTMKKRKIKIMGILLISVLLMSLMNGCANSKSSQNISSKKNQLVAMEQGQLAEGQGEISRRDLEEPRRMRRRPPEIFGPMEGHPPEGPGPMELPMEGYGPQGEESMEGPLKGSRMNTQTLTIEEANKIEKRILEEVGYESSVGGYRIVDTGVTTYYSNTGKISKPHENDSFYGQDATYNNNSPSYTDNGDGTITDNVTGLMWQKDPGEKMTWEEAVKEVRGFDLGGYDDWRLPTLKELYSLIQFTGQSGPNNHVPYIDTDYFVFKYGDETGERKIDSQYATSTIYESSTMNGNTTMFGVNFADGRIKGYSIGNKEFYVMYVRGNKSYGMNNFVDNSDGTITDLSTGLMWLTYDSGYLTDEGAMNWEDALKWCEGLEYAGYHDWKLPNAKELQSIVDYTKSPDTSNSAAINDLFYVSKIKAVDGSINYPYYWTSTTHLDGRVLGSDAVYIAFGEALGYMNDKFIDVHGAGAQRGDPKSGDERKYPSYGKGPQGDVRVVYNYVRPVRIAH